MAPSPSAASYSLPAKYGGDVTTSATQPFGYVERAGDPVVGGDVGRPEPGVELRRVVTLPAAHAEPARRRPAPTSR